MHRTPGIPLYGIFLTLTLTLLVAVHPSTVFGQKPAGPAQWFQEGKKLHEQGHYPEAIGYFEKAVQAQKDFADAYFAMGVAHYKMGQPEKAIHAFREVLRINPASSETHNNLAVLYAELGETNNAIHELQETVRLDPDYSQGHLNLGDLYLSQSIQEYLKVIENEGPDNQKVRLKLRALLTSDPDNADFQFHLGVLNGLEGDLDGAEKNLKQSVRLDPAYRERAYLKLGELLETSSQYPEADKVYHELLRKDPENPRALFAAAHLKNLQEDYSSADALLQKTRRLKTSSEILYESGRARQGMGKLVEAINFYQASLQQKENPEVRFLLGRTYKEKKDYTEALKEYEAILKTYPDPAKVQQEIVEVTRMRLASTSPAAKEETPPGTDQSQNQQIPTPLLALEKEGSSALLVDKSTQTLLLFQNRKGKIRHLKSFACSTGEKNGTKRKMGDKRTPEGIYLFTQRKTDGELPPEYGKMAFPIDYPNLFDRKQGKDGNGIWLHSTNEPIRSYLPQKTRGCVVVNDGDIDKLSQIIRLQETPIIIYDKIPYIDRIERDRLRREVFDFLAAWEESWEQKDVDRFISFYAPSFTSGKWDRAGWKEYKGYLFRKNRTISVELTPYQVLRHKDYLTVTFLQDYRTDRYHDTGIKRLFLVRDQDQWRIIAEEWRKA